jgi:hypothetical protein
MANVEERESEEVSNPDDHSKAARRAAADDDEEDCKPPTKKKKNINEPGSKLNNGIVRTIPSLTSRRLLG